MFSPSATERAFFLRASFSSIAPSRGIFLIVLMVGINLKRGEARSPDALGHYLLGSRDLGNTPHFPKGGNGISCQACMQTISRTLLQHF